MSELAFNLNGEPFEVPGNAIGWRVRKLKPKGAPEVVYGREGTPLVLPIDADMEDLRREARTEGRYRLDALDDHNRVVPPAGYVCIHPSEPTAEPAAPAQPVTPGVDHALVEAMRVNSELARTVIDKFPMMLESAAVLLRAADNAGMPARPPRLIEATDENDDDEADTEADIEEAPPKATGLTGLIETVLTAAAPAIVSAILGGKLEIPGGIGALLDCRRASPKARSAAAARATSTPAASAAPPPSDATANAKRASAPAAPAAAPPAADPPSDLPTLDPTALAHFASIQTALTFREAMLARALAAELTPAQLRTWIAELCTLSVAEAVAKIRTVLGPDASEPADSTVIPEPTGLPESTDGGAS